MENERLLPKGGVAVFTVFMPVAYVAFMSARKRPYPTRRARQ